MSFRVRAIAALALLAGLPFAVAASALGILVASVWLTGRALTPGLVGLGLVALLLVVGLAAAVRGAMRARPRPLPGPELTRLAEPRLWQLVDHLAGRMDVAGPDRIVVGAAANAAVTEVGGRRELVLGLPLIAGLTRAQLAAVLAHELGHYAHGHTRLTARTYRWSLLLEGVVRRVANPVVGRLLTGYQRLYLALTASARRVQELQADDWAARLTDPWTAAAAMERVAHLDAAWSVLVEAYLPLAGPARRRPSLAAGLRHLLDACPAPDPAARDARHPADDSHPPMGERVTRLREAAVAAGLEPLIDPVDAVDLLLDGDRTLEELERLLLAVDDPPADWNEIVELAGTAEDERVAASLARNLLARGHTAPPTVGRLLSLVVDGRGRELLPAPAGPTGGTPAPGPDEAPDDPAVTEALAEGVGALIHLSLAGERRARYAIDWRGPWAWQLWYADRGWRTVDLDELARRAATNPQDASAVLYTLGVWRARLDRVVDPRPPAAEGDLARALWGQLRLRTPIEPGRRRPAPWGEVYDILIFADGVLLVRAPRAQAVALFSSRRAAARAAARCTALVEQVGNTPAEFAAAAARAAGAAGAGAGAAGARWLDRSELASQAHDERTVGKRTTLVLHSGERLVLEHTDATIRWNDPFAALRDLLGG